MKHFTILIVSILILGFNDSRSTYRESKTKKILTSNKWKLILMEETIDKEKTDYEYRTCINFLNNGSFTDACYNIDSAGVLVKHNSSYAVGSWTLKSKTLSIKILQDNQNIPCIFAGDLEIKLISETRIVLFKKIARDKTWTRTYYLTMNHN